MFDLFAVMFNVVECELVPDITNINAAVKTPSFTSPAFFSLLNTNNHAVCRVTESPRNTELFCPEGSSVSENVINKKII